MGVIFGIINIIIAIWFYSSAASVKKQAVMWAAIGAISFFVFKFLGYSMIGFLQESKDQAIISELVDQGYSQSARSTRALSHETAEDQSMTLGIFYEFFPLIIALLAVSFIRAKFILGMGYFASLMHKTPVKLISTKSNKGSSNNSSQFFDVLSDMWKKSILLIKNKKNSSG